MGKVELVTCKILKQGKKQKCTTKLVSGTGQFHHLRPLAARARLSRHGVVFAAGIASGEHGCMSLRLTSLLESSYRVAAHAHADQRQWPPPAHPQRGVHDRMRFTND